MLWRNSEGLLSNSERFERMRSRIANAAFVATHNCRVSGVNPALLPTPSKNALAWLIFLKEPHHLKAQLNCLIRCKTFSKVQLHSNSAEAIWHLQYTPSLYRLRGKGGQFQITVNEAFVFADETVWQAFATLLLGARDRSSRQVVRAYAASDQYAETINLLEAPFSTVDLKGEEIDLEEVFLRVNNTFFKGEIQRPRLEWSQRKTRRQFGYYKPASDILGISRTLDDASLPGLVIDFVMFHELLHKQLGVQEKNGRMMAHTTAFRKAERTFPQYELAMKWLKKLAKEK